MILRGEGGMDIVKQKLLLFFFSFFFVKVLYLASKLFEILT